MLRPVLVVAAALLTLGGLSACSDDPSEPATGASGASGATGAWPDDQLASVRADLAAKFAGDHPEAEDTEAGECFARSFTSATTPDQLEEAGVLADGAVVADLPPLTPDLAARWVESQFSCTDFVEESTRAQQKVAKGGLDEASYAACLTQALTEDEMRAGVQAALEARFDAGELAELGNAQQTCYRRSVTAD